MNNTTSKNTKSNVSVSAHADTETTTQKNEPTISNGSETSTTANITEKDAAGRARRAEYLRLKSRVSELEPENYSKLYFIWQKGSWYRAFGHSAIIFHYDICPKLKRASKLLPDKDYGVRIRGGVVNVRDMDVLEQKLEEFGIHKIKSDNRFYIFNLGKKYTAAELEMFEQTRDREYAFINKVVVPDEIFPHLYKLIRQLQEKIYFVVASSDGYAKESFGIEVVQRMNQLTVNYSLMTKKSQDSGGLSAEEYLYLVIKEMHWLQAMMGVATNVRILEVSKIMQILRESGKIIREANLCLKR